MRTIGSMQDDDFASETSWLRRRTPLGLAGLILAGVLVLACAFGAIGWAGGWFRAGTEVISPTNVKAQWQFAYDYDNALGAIAGNWCSARQAEDESTGDAREQRRSQRLAQESLYRLRQAEYDAALANAFKAKLVRPPDVPATAPTLAEKVNQLDCYQAP